MTNVSSPSVASLDRVVLRTGSLVVDVAIAAGVALVLGLVRLGAPPVWFDEAYTAHAAERSPLWWVENDQYHVLYDGVLWVWVSLAGTSEWALRAPSVVGAMIAAGLLVVLGRKFFDRWTALAAGVLLAASPFVVKWSQQARSYTIVLALSLAATLVLLRALDRGTRGAWALYGVSYALVVVGHAVAGILLAPAHLVLAAQRRERLLPHGPLALVVVVLVAVPWAATVAMRSTGQGAGMAWLETPSPEVVARAVLDVSGAAGLGAALALVGAVFLWRSGSRLELTWLGAWAMAPFALALVMTAVTPVFLDRYLIVAAPAFALLGGIALVRSERWLRLVLASAVVVACCAGLVHWYSLGTSGNWRGEDWRSAVAALEQKSGSGVVVVSPWWANLAPLYYGAEPAQSASSSSTWVLTWSETGHRLTAEKLAQLGLAQHRLVEREEFGRRVSLQHWVRSG